MAELRDNGRISMAALAERINVSRANVYTRVEQMMDDGVITGFSARVDPAKAGLGICALVFLSVHPQTWSSFRSRIEQMTAIESCRVTTGEHDVMLLIRGDEVGAIHDFVIGVLASLPEVKSVETVLVLDEIFDRPFLLPSDLPPRMPPVAPLGLTRFTRVNPSRTSLGR
ncbi:DNA-binding Lrp family transcriptional regulator [Leifsonia psychrotolerans]|uniref:DNA-binding Lrp family transcriptional regulator n=1 Tax=Glaciibacter psychrotolerans TaxID=670054 RepID=A0A7Z0ECY6_9MICO|nr:DNA-binding Lrp family transcriptional regulator [Leifsonia psychrotolerans]